MPAVARPLQIILTNKVKGGLKVATFPLKSGRPQNQRKEAAVPESRC